MNFSTIAIRYFHLFKFLRKSPKYARVNSEVFVDVKDSFFENKYINLELKFSITKLCIIKHSSFQINYLKFKLKTLFSNRHIQLKVIVPSYRKLNVEIFDVKYFQYEFCAQILTTIFRFFPSMKNKQSILSYECLEGIIRNHRFNSQMKFWTK